ncbi:HK97 family phage prohead protease [Mesorhizobium sp. M0933]|uniref:HK97 family phage prohead protease n=1 Tax=Mesorhizobium sp. M0933 TaxID=2957030 RepID=UPI0033390029
MRETLDLLELRFSPPTEDGTLEGIAVKFDVLDSYGTTFDRRAFTGLSGRKIPMLWSHRSDEVVGSWSGFTSTDTELRTTGRLNLEIQRAREVRSMLIAGDVTGISIGFETIKDERKAGGIRHITEAKLHEISLVALPSVPGARVTSVRFGRPSAPVDFIAAVRSATRALNQRK